ncbi:MAG: hypothetical protein ACTSVY_10595, partial [Candidatus Helarchaeota archaeon]
MNKKIGISLIITIFFIGALTFLPSSQASTYQYSSDIHSGLLIQYTITDWNNTAHWYPWPIDRGYWNTSVGELANFTVNQTTAEITLDVQIGNFTQDNLTNSEIGSQLNYNLWAGFAGGIIVNNLSWAITATLIRSAAATMGGEVVITENAVNFSMFYMGKPTSGFNPKGQTTYLNYDKRTGILLEGWSVFGSYWCGMKLVSEVPGNPTTPTPPIPGFEMIFILSTVAIIVLGYALIKKVK